jgi:prepilin-type N-terminal cleavage/methylation domain-containing protein
MRLGVVRSSEKGFSLIENLVAMVVLSIIGLVILSGLYTAAKSDLISQEQTRAESLARSQIEYIKTQPYSTTGEYALADAWSSSPGYSIVDTFDSPMVVFLDADLNELTSDSCLQKIRISVTHGNKTVLTLEDFKAQ